MIIDCVSDLHGFYPKLEGGDLLLLAGDYTTSDKISQWAEFFKWLKEQKYRKKILVAGNHDNLMYNSFPKTKEEADTCAEIREFVEDSQDDFEYLCDSGTEFEGLKIWGSPWTKTFDRMNPKCKAFTFDTEEQLAEKWALIPEGTDILITHGPMHGILDQCIYDGYLCGSRTLRDAVDRVKPRLHVCGHIHEQGGQQLLYKHRGPNTLCVNASYVNERYKPVNKPVRVTL
jgi:Icc-related predicted phosphoesterase